MTEIKYTERGDWVRVSLNGHAMFNPGNDIVCAAVSTITYQLLNVVAYLEAEGHITGAETDIHDGFVIVTFRVIDKPVWQTVWRVIRTGYENIAQAHPQNVRID